MINLHLFLTGFGLGLLISAPVGPVNILCIQRTLARGFWAGFAIGLGAVGADFLISVAAALGITALSGLINQYETEIQFIGGFILIGFGIKIFLTQPKFQVTMSEVSKIRGNLNGIPQSFLLTITNPGALLGIFAIFGSVSTAVGGFESYIDSLMILIGLLSGAMLWWVGLTRLISSLRGKMTEKRLKIINQISGGVLLFAGVGLVFKSLLF
jgi:threonine/homoserine/homoserine lactone efflux protein